ncbi:hypothetical protein INR49_002574 [Caranx melampygus]|nr:hypothetical protein INR49_002574 [Caranx melampygus]
MKQHSSTKQDTGDKNTGPSQPVPAQLRRGVRTPFDNHFLYVMDLRTEAISGRWPLPAYRKSKRGSSFLAGVTSWLNGLDGGNDSGLVFATSMPDHSIHLVLWKENG